MKMKHLYSLCHAGKVFLLALLAAGMLTACSDDDDSILGQLFSPNVTNSDATVSTLTFEWDEVENVSQYVYELRDEEGELVKGDVTQKTRILFTGLQPSTTYTLDVWAYAAIGSGYKGSQVASLTATTADIVTLQMSTPTVAVDNGTAVITWEAVENAASYEYSYMADGGTVSGSTTETSLTLTGLSVGAYNVSITAVPEEGDEAYVKSPAVNAAFTIDFVKQELWRHKGTYQSYELGDSWEATLVAYNDGSYKILNWYNVEGYDLEFTVSGTEMSIENAYYTDYGYYYVYTGRPGAETAYIYTNGYSSFEGNQTAGELWFYAYCNSYDDAGYDTFTWDSSSDSGLTVDDLVGEWSEHSSGTGEWIWYSDAFDWDTNTVTITKVDDQTILISNFFYDDYGALTATFDAANRTIDIASGQTFLTYYTFAAESDINASVAGSISEDATTISLAGWSAWYNGYTYVEGAQTVLTKK